MSQATESEIATFVAERLKPLGGPYFNRYWPVTEEQIAQIEATVGFSLPDDYRQYPLSTGIAAPRATLAFTPKGADYRIFLYVLYGHKRRSSANYSVVDLAGAYLEPQPLLKIGQSQTGAIYLDQHGAVQYEHNDAAGVTKVADSFLTFLSGFAVVGEE